MKKILFITTLFILSCGESGPSACECAQMEKEYIESKMETLTKTTEEQIEIKNSWEEKLEPCTQIITDNKKFEKEKQDCLMLLFQADNEKELEENR
jgi:hypothetical protein